MHAAEADIEAIREQVAKTLADFDTPSRTRALLDSQGTFDRILWASMAELGWLAAGLPEAVGGLGLGLSACCVIAEELGRMVGAVPFVVSTCAITALANTNANGDGHSELVNAALEGRLIFTVALFEAGEAGVPSRSSVSYRDGKITGTKVAVCAGAFADFALTPCADGQLALVDLRQDGVTRNVADTVDNSRGYADLHFNDALASLLHGDVSLEHLLEELALVAAFEQVGGVEACLRLTRDYALQRHAFGQPIGTFQAVKHGLADFYVLLQIARGNALSALQAPPDEFAIAVACARLSAIRAYDHCAQEAIQLHGAIGTTWEAVQHLHLRRSRCLAQEWGGAAFWRDRLLGAALAGARQ